LFFAIHVVLETMKQHLRMLMLKQYSSGNTTVFLKINGKTLEHPEPCSVLGQGTTPGLGLGGRGWWSIFLT